MNEDFLGFEDPADRRAEQGPAFIVGPKTGQRELLVIEEMHRRGSAEFPGCYQITFTMDDENGEIWDPPVAPDYIDEGVRWQRLMRWPEIPDVESAKAHQANARRALVAAWWDRLAAARAEDEAERPN
jgi:hypothetical protein